jgi:hypothetical protein
MTSFAHEYVHLPSAGDFAQCEALLDPIESELTRAYGSGLIAGYGLTLLKNDQDCLEELIKEDWKKLPGARFPILYLAVQPPSVGAMDTSFEERLTSAGFVRVR